MGISRIRFLGRLARRNALRHKGQTIRAILGLLVVTVILTMGLGLGESTIDTFQRVSLQKYGPIDVVLRSQQPIEQGLVDGLAESSGVDGVHGAGTLVLQGPVSNPRTGLAEPEAGIRGVSQSEAAALGTLQHADQDETAPEPGRGEVVISEHLAGIIDARVGDTLILRTQKIGGTQAEETEHFDHVGVAGLPGSAPHAIDVPAGTAHLVTEIQLTGNSGTVTATLRAPNGEEHTDETTGTSLRIQVAGPMDEGQWTLRLGATAPTNYSARTQVTQAGTSTPETVTIEARLIAIVKTEGRAAITEDPTALVNLQDLQEAVGVPDQVNAGYYRVEGDPYGAAEALTDALPDELQDAVGVRANKAHALENAKEEGAMLGAVVIAMGSFTLIAAILLAYTLFSALVEARRAEIGISRALGLSHREVALTMTLEGGLYGFAAAVVGAAIGLGILLLLAEVATRLLPGDPYMAAMALSVSPVTILIAIAIGTLIPLATIGFASLRFARIDPALAIRGLPDDPKGTRRTGLVWAAILILAGLLLFLVHDARPLSVPLALAGVALVANAVGRPSIGYAAAAVAVVSLVWSLYTYEYREEEFEPIIIFASGAMLALGLAALAVSSKRPYQGILRPTGRASGARRSAFIGIRYLIARRRPVGLTMSMIALVTVVVTITGMLIGTAAGSGSTEEGGYQILGEASTAQDGFPRPLPQDIRDDIERAEFLVGHNELKTPTVSRYGQPNDELGEFFHWFLGVPAGFAASNEFSLSEKMSVRAAGYESDDAAWTAVRDGEGIIVPWWLLENDRLSLGETITLQTDTFGPKDLVVIAGLQSDRFGGWIFMAQDDVLQMGPPHKTEILVRVTDGADATHIAHRLSDIFAADGMTFESIEEENAQDGASIRIAALIVESFLAFGLFVGLSSTGFMASRAVHERRRDIGTLRALGYEERDIRGAFILESTLTASMGLLIGTAAGLLAAHSIWWRHLRSFGLEFQPPWLILLGISLAVLGIAILTARGPARRAAKLAPAIAVRHVD